jgi:hypothetical protein
VEGRRGSGALTLLVAGVLANDANDATAPNDLALVANFLDGGTNLHDVLAAYYL